MKGMKKRLLISVALTLVLMFTAVFSAAASAKVKATVKVDGEVITLEKDLFGENGRIQVPLNGVFEKLNAKASWDEKTDKIIIEDNYTQIELVIGDKTATILRKYDFSGIPEKVNLDVAPMKINGTVYVPVRFIAESLGAKVGWESKTKTVVIDTEYDVIPVEKPAAYEVLTYEDIKDSKELTSWYDANFEKEGIYFKTVGNTTYVLVASGEKSTGGYTIEVDSATIVSPGYAYITAKVTSPAPDADVITVITYPHVLLKIVDEGIKNVDGEIIDDAKMKRTIKDIGEAISAEDVKRIALYNLDGKEIKTYDEEDFQKLTDYYNNSEISEDFYIMMITGNKMVITLKDDTTISFTSYGSKTNVVASIVSKGQYGSYHLVCPEIAEILLGE